MKDLISPSVFKFEGIHFDAERLYADYEKITASHPRQGLCRFSVNHPDGCSSDSPIEAWGDPSNVEFQEAERISKTSHPDEKTAHLSKWKAENLLDPFKGTYFEEVIQELQKFMRKKGAIIGPIQLFEVCSKSCWPWHQDNPAFYTIHVPIKTQEGCLMISELGLSTMLDAGGVYGLQVHSNKHTAANASSETRVHLILTVMNPAKLEMKTK